MLPDFDKEKEDDELSLPGLDDAWGEDSADDDDLGLPDLGDTGNGLPDFSETEEATKSPSPTPKQKPAPSAPKSKPVKMDKEIGEDELFSGGFERSVPKASSPEPADEPAPAPTSVREPLSDTLKSSGSPTPKRSKIDTSHLSDKEEKREPDVDLEENKILTFGAKSKSRKKRAKIEEGVIENFDPRENRAKKANAVKYTALGLVVLIAGLGLKNTIFPPDYVSPAEVQGIASAVANDYGYPLQKGQAFAQSFIEVLLESSTNTYADDVLSYYYGDSGNTLKTFRYSNTYKQKVLYGPVVFEAQAVSPYSAYFVVGASVQRLDAEGMETTVNSALPVTNESRVVNATVPPDSEPQPEPAPVDPVDPNVEPQPEPVEEPANPEPVEEPAQEPNNYAPEISPVDGADWVFFNVNVYYDSEKDKLSITEDSPTVVPPVNVLDRSDIPSKDPLGKALDAGEAAELESVVNGFIKGFAESSSKDHEKVDQYITDNTDPNLIEGFDGRYSLPADYATAISYKAFDDGRDGILLVRVNVRWSDSVSRSATASYNSTYIMRLEQQPNGKYLVSKFDPEYFVAKKEEEE